MSTSRPYTFDRVVRLVITTIVVCAAVWLIYRLRGVLLPFCVAALIAYIFEPFVQFNRELLRLKGRVAAIFITLFRGYTGFRSALLHAYPYDNFRDGPYGSSA